MNQSPNDVELLVIERGFPTQYDRWDSSESEPQSDFSRLARGTRDAFLRHSHLIGSTLGCCEIEPLPEAAFRFLSQKRTKGINLDSARMAVTKASGTAWPSNVPLAILHEDLLQLGYITELDERLAFKMPYVDELTGPQGVLHGRAAAQPKINVDAYHAEMKIIFQVEAGQGWANKNYLRNLFEGIVLSESANYIGMAICAKCTQTLDDFRNVAPRLYALYRALNPPSIRGLFLISY